MGIYKDSPFKDAVGADSVPTRGSKGGEYDSSEVPDTPGRSGGLYPELHRDTQFGAPKDSGPYTHVLFKDAVGK
jgi:hypothetical protein